MAKYTIYPNKTVNYISQKGTHYKLLNKNGELICISNKRRCRPTKEILSKFALPGGSYTIYTDGGCIRNPGGRGGYGCVIIEPTGSITQLSGGYISTTNNRMEIIAAIEAIKTTPQKSKVTLYSDSKYLVLTMQGAYQKNKNLDLWDVLETECSRRNVRFKWIKGHSDNKLNNVCDRLATEAMNSNTLSIDAGYKGKAEKSFMLNITADENVPKTGDINNSCLSLLSAFRKKENPSFKDYAQLKTGGRDIYSEMDINQLQSICGANIKEILTYVSESELAYVLRWNCRGLSVKDSIKKILVDKEISENINKKRVKK